MGETKSGCNNENERPASQTVSIDDDEKYEAHSESQIAPTNVNEGDGKPESQKTPEKDAPKPPTSEESKTCILVKKIILAVHVLVAASVSVIVMINIGEKEMEEEM